MCVKTWESVQKTEKSPQISIKDAEFRPKTSKSKQKCVKNLEKSPKLDFFQKIWYNKRKNPFLPSPNRTSTRYYTHIGSKTAVSSLSSWKNIRLSISQPRQFHLDISFSAHFLVWRFLFKKSRQIYLTFIKKYVIIKVGSIFAPLSHYSWPICVGQDYGKIGSRAGRSLPREKSCIC